MASSKDRNRRGLETTYGLELEVKDKDGKVIKRHVQDARSFLPNYMKWLLVTLGNKSLSVIDINGNAVAITNNRIGQTTTNFLNHILAPAGNDGNGIRVGSSNQPVSPLDYNLIAFIPTGTSAGRLQYGACDTDVNILLSGNESSFIASRTFTNASGGAVTVGEAGIVMFHFIQDGTLEDVRFLIARDAIATPISVPDGATLTVRYKFRIVT
jgi:hypothetical protein